jgi:hypothetical protein
MRLHPGYQHLYGLVHDFSNLDVFVLRAVHGALGLRLTGVPVPVSASVSGLAKSW